MLCLCERGGGFPYGGKAKGLLKNTTLGENRGQFTVMHHGRTATVRMQGLSGNRAVAL